MNTMTEDTLVQQTTADYLHDVLNWDASIYAMQEVLGSEGTLGRESEREVVLVRYLAPKLKELNPGLPEEAYADAIRIIAESSSSSTIITTNREKDQLIRNGVQVTYRNEKGERLAKRLRLFDFDHPEANHFLVVRELWVKGSPYRRRADIVGFVNGIPLLFMELKNINRTLKAAYEENLSDYKDTIPHLFYYNAFVVLGNGDEAKIGSVSSKFEHFSTWKRLHEEEPGAVDMETLLKGVCSKKNFMDILENFILFDDSSGRSVKIVARNHQFMGVNKAIDAVRNRRERLGKLGVFWHTQGSGKSYSIAYFARKVHRKLGGNYTFVVLTDREDLDTQIYKTFVGVGLADNDKDPCRTASGEHLKALLGQHKTFVFSLIQKFNKQIAPGEEYSLREDLIVITDEAHRTQYGTLALNMRNALPNASFIGFTGTPLFKDDEITSRVFGDYVSTYDFQRAVEDEATVPLFYDARGEKLGVATNDLNERIAAKLEELEIEDIDVEARLEKELKRDYHIITADTRLEAIAKDFVEHYSIGWENGKAMFVCIDKITSVRIHGLILKEWEQRIKELERELKGISDDQEVIFRTRQIAWMRETQMAVVISEEQGEVDKFRKWGLDIVPHRTLLKEGYTSEDGKRLDLESAFKKPDHPFRVAIVCAMWLTGFDVPTLSTLYLDKPLKAHTLMQAIARANRVVEGKNNGLIVDYCGILKNLRSALATFAGRGDEGHEGEEGEKDPARPDEELLEELKESIALAHTFLLDQGFELSRILESSGFERNAAIKKAKEAVNENDRTRKQFEIMAREVFKKFKSCINIRPQINDYRNDRDAINIIYKSLQQDRDQADISDIMRELHALVNDAIEISPDQSGPTRLYDISKIDFDRLRREFEKSTTKRTTVQNLKDALQQKLADLLKRNPLRTDFQKHYEEIIDAYNSEKDRVTIEHTFDALITLMGELGTEESRAMREGLDEETLALYDLLKKPTLSKEEISQLKKVAIELLETLKKERLRVANWQEKEATRDAVHQAIFDFLYDERTGLPVNSYTPDDVANITEEVYTHIYRAYPTVPSPIYA